MRIRPFPAAALLGLAAFAAAAPAAPAADKAAKSGKPTLVVRLDPLETLIEDFRFLAAQAGKEEEAKQFEGILKARTGDQGLDGLDVKKPMGLYGTLAENIHESEVVLLLPVAGEKEFLAMLERLDLKAEEGKDGVYTVNIPQSPFPAFFRFDGGYAHATLRDPAPIAKDRLRKPSEVLPAGGAASITLNLDAIPESIKDLFLSQLSNKLAEEKAKSPPGENEAQKAGRDAGAALVGERFKELVKDGAGLTARVDVDRKAGELRAAFSVSGRPDSKMAAAIADLAKAPSVAAGLTGGDAAVRLLGHVRLPDPIRDLLVTAFEKGARDGLAKEKDEAQRRIGKSVVDALMPTVRAGELDGGAALRGPDAKGLYTLIVAGRVREGRNLEKALKDALEKAPADAKGRIKLDVAKAGDAAVHRIEPEKVDAQTRELLGEGPIFLAVRDDAVFAAAGPDAEEAVKAAAATPAGPAPVAAAVVSVGRLSKFMAKENPKAPEVAKEVFAKTPGADRISLTVEGGAALTVRLTLKTRLLEFFTKLEERKKS